MRPLPPQPTPPTTPLLPPLLTTSPPPPPLLPALGQWRRHWTSGEVTTAAAVTAPIPHTPPAASACWDEIARRLHRAVKFRPSTMRARNHSPGLNSRFFGRVVEKVAQAGGTDFRTEKISGDGWSTEEIVCVEYAVVTVPLRRSRFSTARRSGELGVPTSASPGQHCQQSMWQAGNSLRGIFSRWTKVGASLLSQLPVPRNHNPDQALHYTCTLLHTDTHKHTQSLSPSLCLFVSLPVKMSM